MRCEKIEKLGRMDSLGTMKNKCQSPCMSESEFVAEFHKNANKIEVDEDGASYAFDFKL